MDWFKALGALPIRKETFLMPTVTEAREPPALTIDGLKVAIKQCELVSRPSIGRIIVSEHWTERVLHARSPARARRRMARKGRKTYPQHYREQPRTDAVTLPSGDMIVHPVVMDQIRRETASRLDRHMDGVFMNTLYGIPVIGR